MRASLTRRRASALVALAMISVALTACTSAPIKHAHPAHALAPPESLVAPSPTSTPASTDAAQAGPTTYDYGLTQADVAPLMADTVYQLNQLPTSKMAELNEYYAQSLPAFAQDWQAISQNADDVLPLTVSASNTPYQIDAFTWMQFRQAATLTQADGFHFDKKAADRYVTAQLINGTLSKSYAGWIAFVAQFDGPNAAPSARTLAVSNYLQLPIITKSSAKYTDAAGHRCIDLATTRELNSGPEEKTNVTACLITNKYGSVWMIR